MTHCKGRIHPKQHHTLHNYHKKKKVKQQVLAVILCPSFIFVTSHHDLCASPPNLRPTCSPHGKPPRPPHLIPPLHLVTMQIYLSPLARKTGSSEAGKFATTVPAGGGGGPPPAQQSKATGGSSGGGGSKSQGRKSSPTFTLNLQKSTSSQSTSVQEECGYKSPIKSPSQYFQICY